MLGDGAHGALFDGDARGLLEGDSWVAYDWHRERAPLGYSASRRTYFLFRYEDVRRAFASTEFTTEQPFRRSRRMFGRTMLDSDGDLHDRLRSVLVEPLKPSRIDGYRDELIRPAVDMALTRVADQRRIDWLADVGDLVPTRVIAGLLGLRCDLDRLHTALVPLADQVDHGQVTSARIEQSRHELLPVIDAMLRARPPSPGPLGEALSRGVEEGVLTIDEARDNAILLLVAATATTASAIANTMWLATETGAFAQIVAGKLDPADVAQESLRLEPPLRFSPRFVRHDTELHGGAVRAGSAVQLCVASANRDAEAYGDPDTFLPGRQGQPPSLSFWRGVHSCVGAFVAQSEVAVVLAEAANRFPRLSLDSAPRFRPGWSFRRPHEVLTRIG